MGWCDASCALLVAAVCVTQRVLVAIGRGSQSGAKPIHHECWDYLHGALEGGLSGGWVVPLLCYGCGTWCRPAGILLRKRLFHPPDWHHPPRLPCPVCPVCVWGGM